MVESVKLKDELKDDTTSIVVNAKKFFLLELLPRPEKL